VSLEDEVRTLRATVEAQHKLLLDVVAKLDKLRDDVRPKMLRRRDVAPMLGLTPDGLRQHLHRGKSGASELGAKLLELAHDFAGEQVWYPSEIQMHCTRWVAGEVQQ